MFPTPAPKRPRVTVKASAVPLKQLEINLGTELNRMTCGIRTGGFLKVTRTKYCISDQIEQILVFILCQ